MKRLLTSLAIAATLGAILMQPAAAKTRACTYRMTPKTWSEQRVQALIRCVFSRVGVPEEIPTALYVADRESSLYPWSVNVSSGCAGLFQMAPSYWRGRVMAYLPLDQFPHKAEPTFGPLRARANAWVAAVMVKRGGWGPWAL